MESVRRAIRARHYSIRTETAYAGWIRRYIRYHRYKHPRDMGAPQVVQFLSYLANERRVAASTQSQALNALNFLYGEVLGQPLGELPGVACAKPTRRPPGVLSRGEVRRILSALEGEYWLIACLLCASGLRVMEVLRLRVGDLDFGRRCLTVRDGEGAKDRMVTLADELIPLLKRHLATRRTVWQRDLANAVGAPCLPDALSRKLGSAALDWPWQYVFAARQLSIDPRSGKRRRDHLTHSAMRKALRRAVLHVGLDVRIDCHTLRHSFASHWLECSADIQTVQDQAGLADVAPSQTDAHVLNRGAAAVQGPLEVVPAIDGNFRED